MLTPTPCAVLGRKELSGRWVLTLAGCAAQVGGVIGKAGGIVKQVRDETGARIRVVEGLPNSEERVIVISAPNMAGQPTHAAQVRLIVQSTDQVPTHAAQVCISVRSADRAESFDCAGYAACRCRDG